MKRCIPLVIVMIAVVMLCAASQAFAQHVRYLSGNDLSSGNLVHVLTPKGPRPRGVGLKPPECTHLLEHAKTSRGLAPVAKADIASIEVEFDVNSATLTPESEKTLDTLGQALNSATLKPCCFEVEGYTDATGGVELNQKLSEARASSVIDYLSTREGIEPDRMMPKGLGKSHPIASNDTEEGRQKNRRVQVVNLGYGV
jgi:outer membrane protein OmpA-like peptidoglycan-associated protein